jgi:hypothetical protein
MEFAFLWPDYPKAFKNPGLPRVAKALVVVQNPGLLIFNLLKFD